MLSVVMETEQRTLHVVCGDGNRTCMLSVVMETEQRTLHVVCGDGNRAENIACCLW